MAGSVGKEGSSWYYILELGKDQNGKRIRKKKRGLKTEKEAKKALRKAEMLFDNNGYVEDDRTTLREFMNYWLDNYAKISTTPKTFEGYDYIIRKHLGPGLGLKKLSKLSPMDLQKYYTDKINEGMSAQSVKHHHRLLSKILKDAVLWQKINRNVATLAKPPKPQKVEMRTLDPKQVSTLLSVAKESEVYYPVIFTAVHTGLRRGEILGLRWQDVDLKNGVLYVQQTLQSVSKLGLVFKPPKSGKGRPVKMTGQHLNLLKQINNEQNQNKLLYGPDYNKKDLVFIQVNGNPIQPSELTREYKKILKKACLPSIRFHDLRHTHATLMLQKGIHPKIVAERLGHSSIKITLDIYSHVLPNMQEEAVSLFEQLLDD